MVDVAVVGAGQTKYGHHVAGLKGMWAEAASKAFASIDGDDTRNWPCEIRTKFAKQFVKSTCWTG